MKKNIKIGVGLLGVLTIIVIVILMSKDNGKLGIYELSTIWNKENRRENMLKSDSMVKEYTTFNEMKNDSTLQAGDVCKVLGYDEPGDGGISYWKIKKNDSTNNFLSFDIASDKLVAEYILENNVQINVKAIGIKSEDDSDETRERNATILKELISKYKKNICFYFPIGNYFFNQIDIDDVGIYEITLYGEFDGKSNASLETTNVTILTPESGFINRTTVEGNNETRFNVTNIGFKGASFYDKKPIGICLGTINNNGGEYNFNFQNVFFYGYEYGFKSPGYTCGGSRGQNVKFCHCVYGMYIEGASHNLVLESIDLNACKYGIRLGVGGNPCSISNIHVAVGCYEGIEVKDDEKMYGIHTKGGVVIDSIYYEQYSGELDVSNYTLIDYEGWGHGNVGKVIIKNTPINSMGAGGKGYFFTGSTYIGEGPETKKENIFNAKREARNNYFGNGCVEFINCITTGSVELLKNRIKVSFNMDGGLENGFGFTFDDLDLFGDGLAFTKNYRRRFNSYLSNGTFIDDKLMNVYTTLSIPEENRVWSGINFPVTPIVDNAENLKGTQYKGKITIDNIISEDVDITLGIIGKVDGEYKMIREIYKIDKSKNNQFLEVYVDEYISKKEANDIFFGYVCNSGRDKKLNENDEKKINYDIEINYDNLEMVE